MLHSIPAGTLQPLGLSGLWTLAMPAPRVVGLYGKGDLVVGVEVGGAVVPRLDLDPATGQREAVDTLIHRAALALGTAEVYTLQYAN